MLCQLVNQFTCYYQCFFICQWNLSLRYVTLRRTKGEIRQNYYFFAILNEEVSDDLVSNEGVKEGRAGVTAGPVSQGTAGGRESGSAKSAKVNLNTAGKEELMTLKGIGESKAEDIIRYRETYGPFERIEDIMNISGIKDAAFQKIKDSITV